MITIEGIFYFLAFFSTALLIYQCTLIVFYSKKKKTRNELDHKFSVIICAHNEAENLKKNIPLILMQDYSEFEVLVVLDRCTDNSFDILSNIFEHDPRLRVVTINHVSGGFHPKKYGITKAIEMARHEWLLLTDADCAPVSKNWIQSFSNKIEAGKEIILGLSPYETGTGFLGQLISYETHQTALSYIASSIGGTTYMGVGRNLVYNKEIFMKNEGFGENKGVTGGDDDLFIQRVAKKHNVAINLDENSLTKSPPKRTWYEYFQQKTRHLSVGKYYPASIKFQLTISSLLHTLVWLIFIFLVSFKPDPWIVSGVFALVIIIKGLVSKYASRKLHMNWNIVLFPILDFAYAILLPLMGLRSFLIKKIQWN
ncbi:MAG: glycosyltransferase [Cyclobacteriaceae bacterium]